MSSIELSLLRIVIDLLRKATKSGSSIELSGVSPSRRAEGDERQFGFLLVHQKFTLEGPVQAAQRRDGGVKYVRQRSPPRLPGQLGG